MQVNKRSSINTKLTRLVTISVASALLFAYAASVFNELLVSREQLSDQMSVLAEVLAENAAAAVAFDDPDSARQVLEALKLEPSVESAVIYTAAGQPFAQYVEAGSNSPQLPQNAPPEGCEFDADGHLGISLPIRVQGEPVGTFFLHASNDHVYERLTNYSISMALVLLVSFLAVKWLSSRLQRGISEPILSLAHAAEQVSAEQNYSIRVERSADDELGVLVDEFNHMLEQIDVGKRALEVAHERLAKQSEERMRAIVETAADGIVTVSAEGLIESCNSASCDLLKIGHDELVGCEFLSFFPKLSGESWQQFVHSNLHNAGKYTRSARQLSALCRDGTSRSLLLSLSEFSIDGETDGAKAYTAILRDLTEFERLQVELAQAQKLESIGQLSAGIAHEINTPMQFISDNIGFLRESIGDFNAVLDKYDELLQPSQPPADWEVRCQAIQEAKTATRFEFNRTQIALAIEESQVGVERIIQIVRAMKQFSHFGTGQMSEVNLNDAICSTATITRNRWKYVSNLELELDPNLPSVVCAASEINQVLLNLVVNAADAIADKVGQDPEVKGKITVRTSSDSQAVQIEVEDTGCGIPEHIRHRIFDPFYTTKEVGKGTGQGLAITHEVVVSMHHGTIHVRSKPGEGTTFVVRLPLEQSQKSEYLPKGDAHPAVLLDGPLISGDTVTL